MEIGSQKKITFTEQQATAYSTFLQHNFRILMYKCVMCWCFLAFLSESSGQQPTNNKHLIIWVNICTRWNTRLSFTSGRTSPCLTNIEEVGECHILHFYRRITERVKDESSLSTNNRSMDVLHFKNLTYQQWKKMHFVSFYLQFQVFYLFILVTFNYSMSCRISLHEFKFYVVHMQPELLWLHI